MDIIANRHDFDRAKFAARVRALIVSRAGELAGRRGLSRFAVRLRISIWAWRKASAEAHPLRSR